MTAQGLTVLLFFLGGFVGGMARVYRYYGLKGFTTPKLVVDAVFSAAGGVLYPYLVPGVVAEKIPTLAVALGVAAVTYWANHLFVTLLKKWFGYTAEASKNDAPKSEEDLL